MISRKPYQKPCITGMSFVKSQHMKSIFFYAAFCCSLLAACQSRDNSGKANEEEKEPEKKVSKRDYSITKANSYSTLFLDSTNMEQFIANKKLDDKIARRMRSFYNTRN